jgi:hypothetical protein
MKGVLPARLTGRIGSLAILVLIACVCGSPIACVDETPRVTTGKQFPIEHTSGIRRHISTTKDVLELLGDPYEKKRLDGRRKRWRYYSITKTKNSILFFFEGSTSVREEEVVIVFDGSLVESIKKSSDNYSE